MANVQSYLGLNPIVAQAGGLSALQQGATPYTPTPIPQGVNINPAAGQMGGNFALGVYGDQTQQYGSLLGYNSSIYNAQLDYNARTYASQMSYAASRPTAVSYISAIGGLI